MATISNQSSTSYHVSGEAGTSSVATSNIHQMELQSNGELTLSKTPNVSGFDVGDIITYTISITNNSSSDLTGVRIIDNLGGGNLAYVLGSGMLTASSTTYPVTPVATNPLTFTLQELNVGQTMTLVYKSQVVFNLPGSVTSITNSVQGIGYTCDGTITGSTSSTIQKKIALGLTVVKTASETSVTPGQNFDYKLTHTNTSQNVLVIDSITDQLPTGFVINSIISQVLGSGAITLQPSDYTLSGSNYLTITSANGSDINVPAGGTLVIIINGHF